MKEQKGKAWVCLAAALGLVLPLVTSSAQAADWKPTKAVEFYVPAGTGGGTDQFARLVQSIIVKHKLMDQNIVVLNKAGGSGAEAFLDIATSRGDPHKIVILRCEPLGEPRRMTAVSLAILRDAAQKRGSSG